MKDEQTTCTPCEQNFEDNINELVDQTGRGNPLEINHSLFKELTCKYTLIS